jgi:hypothetical protein
MDKDWFKKMFLDEAKKACVRHSSAPSTSTPDTPDTPEEEDQIEDKGVLFIDYNGKHLYSYTVQEAQALTKLPPLPEHEGLICQGWNWTLDQIKEQDGEVVVGPYYITDDGATRLYISVDEYTTRVSIHMSSVSSSNIATVSIDWGDETVETVQVPYGSYPKGFVHQYAKTGDYVIRITSNAQYNMGCSQQDYDLYTYPNVFYKKETSKYNPIIKKVETGSYVTFQPGCFCNCSSLETVTISNDIGDIKNVTFKNCTRLRAFVGNTYGAECLFGCTELKALSISCGMTGLVGSNFKNCTSLTKVTLPYTITSLEGGYMGSAWGFTSAGIFRGCSKLQLPKIPPNATGLGYGFLANVKTFTKIDLPNKLTDISAYAFFGCNLKEVELPDSVTSVGEYAFSDNYNLGTVKLSNNTTRVDEYAFRNARKLKKIVIPPKVSTIWEYAFSGCSALTEVIFEGNIKRIGKYAFSNAPVKLYDFTACTSVPTLDSSYIFGTASDGQILVPGSLYNEWIIATNWANYMSKLVPVGEVVGENAIGTWVFNDTIIGELGTMNVLFGSSYWSGYTQMIFEGDILTYSGPSDVKEVWDTTSGWKKHSTVQKTITITGGADAINPIFIEWLKANATKTS